MWVYKVVQFGSQKGKWQVGFFDPLGEWYKIGDAYETEHSAAMKVHYLNGGNESSSVLNGHKEKTK